MGTATSVSCYVVPRMRNRGLTLLRPKRQAVACAEEGLTKPEPGMLRLWRLQLQRGHPDRQYRGGFER
jgi:hypothetical protein